MTKKITKPELKKIIKREHDKNIVLNIGKHFRHYGVNPKEYFLAQLFRIRDYIKGLMDLGIEDRFMSEIHRDILAEIERRGRR